MSPRQEPVETDDESGSRIPDESHMRSAFSLGDHEAVATAALQAYGAEIYSFLLAWFRGNQTAVEDAFSSFVEDFWRALPRFEWRCSLRAWCYRLARSSASRVRRSPHERRERRQSLSGTPLLDELVEHARTSTGPHLRTEVKDEFRKLRDQLSPDDRDLLTLRVDRELAWRDIACVMLSGEDAYDEERLKRLEATLRQRFSDVKRRLKKLATDAGLI